MEYASDARRWMCASAAGLAVSLALVVGAAAEPAPSGQAPHIARGADFEAARTRLLADGWTTTWPNYYGLRHCDTDLRCVAVRQRGGDCDPQYRACSFSFYRSSVVLTITTDGDGKRVRHTNTAATPVFR